MFPNNLGALLLYRVLFSFSNLLSVKDYYLVALIYNVIMLQLMVALVFDVCKRIEGRTAAVFSLLAFAVFLPFYMMGGVFYTDLLSAPFAILTLDLYLRGKEQQCGKKRLVGMISHIPDLATRVNQQIKVSRGPAGSHANPMLGFIHLYVQGERVIAYMSRILIDASADMELARRCPWQQQAPSWTQFPRGHFSA